MAFKRHTFTELTGSSEADTLEVKADLTGATIIVVHDSSDPSHVKIQTNPDGGASGLADLRDLSNTAITAYTSTVPESIGGHYHHLRVRTTSSFDGTSCIAYLYYNKITGFGEGEAQLA